MREDESDPFRFAELRQILECIHGCTVDRRYAPHPENETFCEILYYNVLNRIRRAKEERSCDLVYTDFQRQLLQMFIHRRGIIVYIDPAVGVRFLAHPLDEKQAGQNHADLDCDNEVKHNGQHKRSKKNDNITLRSRAYKMHEGSPLAHIVGNKEQNRGNRRHRNHARKRHQHNKNDDERNGMHHTRNRRASAVFDICRRSGNRSRSRNTAEKRRSNISGTLCNQLCIRTMLAVDHAVCNNTGEKRLNRRKHRDRKRIWNRRLNQFHVKNRQMKRRKRIADCVQISNRRNVQRQKLNHQNTDNNSNQRSRDFLENQRRHNQNGKADPSDNQRIR